MNFAHCGKLSVTLLNKVLELDGNRVFEIYLGGEGCLVTTRPHLDNKCLDLYLSMSWFNSMIPTLIL